MTKQARAAKIARAVLRELEDRKGFSWWWDGIEGDIQKDIRKALTLKVEKILEECS